MSISTPIKLITDGLVFNCDTKSPRSYLGAPTTNLTSDPVNSNYNNVPGSVSTVLTQTTDLYKGVPIWKQTLTPLDASGVSWLSNGNNPGLGVVTGGGGGLANRYTGHSIYFKPTVQMFSNPIYTHYSNIAGWQSSTNYDIQWDGWYRAHVIWYDTVTRSDGKYWAINPLSAIVNVPIVIYWAAPFKEDSNRSNFVAPFAQYGSPRSVTGALFDMMGNYTIDLTSAVYDSLGQITYNGSSGFLSIPTLSPFMLGNSPRSMFAWIKTSYTGNQCIISSGSPSNSQAFNLVMYSYQKIGVMGYNNDFYPSTGANITDNKWHYVGATFDGNSTLNTYVDGVLDNTASRTFTTTGQNNYIGKSNHVGVENWFNGSIRAVHMYNRALNANEILQNYNSGRILLEL